MTHLTIAASRGPIDIEDAIQSPYGVCEDVTAVFEIPAGAAVLLADGCSTGGNGLLAAQAVVKDAIMHMTLSRWDPAALPRAILAADRACAARSGTGTATLIAAIVADDQVWLASTGDSQAWLFGRDRVELTARQERRRVGDRIALPELKGPEPLDGHLVLASDGLWRLLWPEHAHRVVEACSRQPAAALIDHLIERHDKLIDDTSVITVARRPLPAQCAPAGGRQRSHAPLPFAGPKGA